MQQSAAVFPLVVPVQCLFLTEQQIIRLPPSPWEGVIYFHGKWKELGSTIAISLSSPGKGGKIQRLKAQGRKKMNTVC